jgi:hypothetical protein
MGLGCTKSLVRRATHRKLTNGRADEPRQFQQQPRLRYSIMVVSRKWFVLLIGYWTRLRRVTHTEKCAALVLDLRRQGKRNRVA